MGTYGVATSNECASILAILGGLSAPCYEGVPQGEDMDRDGWGQKVAYRDVSFGSVLPTASAGRTLGLGENDQPHIWTFEVRHTAPTRNQVRLLAEETDKTLIGWSPTANSTQIKPFYYIQYDSRNLQGMILSYTAIRFYETTLGVLTP